MKELVDLLAQAKKTRLLKKEPEYSKLYYMGTREARAMVERIRRDGDATATAQEEERNLDIKIWEDDWWCLGFTYAIQLMAGMEPKVEVLEHGHTPLGIHEPHFMQGLLDLPYIRNRETYEMAQPKGETI